MGAVSYVLRRMGELLLLLFVLSVVVFALLYLAPGDPARTLVGARQVSPEIINAIRAQHHLDEPFWRQYLYWVSNLASGDLGVSIRTGLPVTQMLASRAGLTLQLAVSSCLIAVAIGLPAGIAAAKRHGEWRDRAITATAVAGVSAPSYAVGLLALYIFAGWLGWFPVFGAGDGSIGDRIWHLALPSLTLAIGVTGSLIKVTRAAMVREVEADYSVFSRSRGLGEAAITRSQLRNSALPIVTSVGLILASLAGGTVLVESTFALGGLGSLLTESVTSGDVPVVQGITLLMAVFICGISAVVDAVAGVIDPRLRVRKEINAVPNAMMLEVVQ